jgi:hypothetical protein
VHTVVSIIISDVKVAIAVLLVGSLFVAKRSLLEVNYRPDGLGYNNVAIAVNELHVSKKMPIGYKINE